MRKQQLGFTIIELMTVIAVLGVALSIAVPGLQQFIMTNRLTSQLNQLSSSLAFARSEAVKQNQSVQVCVSSDGAQCDTTGVDWNKGWLVFVDRNQDQDYDAGGPGVDGCATGATADCLLITQKALPGTNALKAAAGFTKYVAYNGNGVAQCDNGPPCDANQMYFVLCDSRGAAHARALAVSKTGRTSILDKKPNGNALTCTP